MILESVGKINNFRRHREVISKYFVYLLGDIRILRSGINSYKKKNHNTNLKFNQQKLFIFIVVLNFTYYVIQ